MARGEKRTVQPELDDLEPGADAEAAPAAKGAAKVAVVALLAAVVGGMVLLFPRTALGAPLLGRRRGKRSGGTENAVTVAGYTLRFPNNWPDSTFFGVSFPGLCGGMVFTVLDYLNAGVRAPTTSRVPSTHSPLGRYIQGRQVDSLLGPNGLSFIELLASSDATVAEATVQAYAQIKATVDAGSPAPLGLVPPVTTDVTSAHQVLAIGYRDDVDGGKVVKLWDPNRPTSETEMRQAPDETLWQETGGDVWRGFFVAEYKSKTPPPSAAAAA